MNDQKYVCIYAEKPDMGTKIAAALDCITLDNGKKVGFNELKKYENEIRKQRIRDGFFEIKYGGKRAFVTWGFGHMCGLKQAYDYNPAWKDWKKLPLPFIPENYELKLTGPENQYCLIERIFKGSGLIIAATDDDREGDLIFEYIYSFMNCRVPFVRALFNKQSKEEFQKAFQQEKLVTSQRRRPVIEAGRARSAGDFAVGSNLTAAMTLKYPGSGILSVGRVQTAVLNMIVERESTIRGFRPQDYWVLSGKFTADGKEPFSAIHQKKRFNSKHEAEELRKMLQNTGEAYVESIEISRYKKGKPYLYSLATLQMDANQKYGFSLDKTLELAQSLYESGYTTYPRTDSVHLSDDMVGEMNRVLDMLFSLPAYRNYMISKPVTMDRHYFDSKKVESHYAIVPTSKKPGTMSKDEGLIYDLIARSAMCIVYPEAVMSKTKILISAGGEYFQTTGSSVIDMGYMRITGLPKQNLLPDLREGEQLNAEYQIETKKTEPPKRYTDATLLKAMINCGKNIEDEDLKKLMANGPGGKPRGLGRPSSQASIVATLESRGYTEKKGKTIHPTEKGQFLIQSFPIEELKSAEMTARWERRLDHIEAGSDSYDSFMDDLQKKVIQWTKQLLQMNASEDFKKIVSSGWVCPHCGSPVIEYSWGYRCTSTKGCEFSFGKKISGVTLTQKEIDSILKNGNSGIVNGFKSRQGKTFSAVLVSDPSTGKIVFDFQGAKLHCPVCHRVLIKTNRGYCCSGYREQHCSFAIGKICQKELSDIQVRNLLSGKKVKVNGMTGKSGKKFDAYLKMVLQGENAGMIEFEFIANRKKKTAKAV